MDILKVKVNNEWVAIPSITGPRGIGIQSITKTNTQGLVDTYTILFSDGNSTTFNISNGAVPSFTIGTVTEGPTAAVTVTGTDTNPVLNLTLPNANVPTAVSELNNDAGYATESYVDTAVSNVNTMNIHICAQGEYNAETGIPTIQNPDTQTFYLVPGGEGNNLFIEWAYVNSAWERFGSADVDLSNYVQKTDYATSSNAGVVKVAGLGVKMSNDELVIAPASSSQMKRGSGDNAPIVAAKEHEATFYGLAKAAGDSTQSQSNNAVGTYTDEAKAAIQQMLDVPSNSDVDAYATKADTVLETTLSRGRKSGTTVGIGSVAFGGNVEASGNQSHAEGSSSIASGAASHAEGMQSIASGNYSHAEGRQTNANGAQSHAEGRETIANAVGSHTEGYGTVANARYSHISGRYNIEDSYTLWPEWIANTTYAVGDKVKVTNTANNETTVTGYICKTANSDAEFDATKWTKDTDYNYAEIIGNGTADDARSNAYALTWTGDGHYAGDVYVHANADSTGGTKLATVEDIPVQDVQVAGTSVVGSDGVAEIPLATSSQVGVVSVGDYGISVSGANNTLVLSAGAPTETKTGTNIYRPVVVGRQHQSVFYGLSKVAGVDLKNETVTLGTYPEASKTAIKAMLGVEEGLRVVRLI